MPPPTIRLAARILWRRERERAARAKGAKAAESAAVRRGPTSRPAPPPLQTVTTEMHHQSKFKPCGLQPNHRTFGTSEYAPAPPSSGPLFRWSPCVRSTHPAARPSNHAHAGWEQVGWGSWEAVAALGDHWAALPAARVRKSIQAA